MTTFSWSPTCTSSLKSWGGVPDYADSELPLLGPLADVNSSFKLDFVAGQCINKHNKLVPYNPRILPIRRLPAVPPSQS